MAVYKKVNLYQGKPDRGKNTFGEALEILGNKVVRDTIMLLTEQDSVSKRLNVGYTVIYPQCSTRGHEHPPLEEVYFITSGRGIMEVGQERFEVESGDVVYVPSGFHRAENPFPVPLSYFWITVKKD
ncbi:MAG: cupin domain-containing protein [Candidatus Atribacteria bacterium]|nr:cupin domain-containing protein [Candidatus Atribacteria bacterium]